MVSSISSDATSGPYSRVNTRPVSAALTAYPPERGASPGFSRAMLRAKDRFSLPAHALEQGFGNPVNKQSGRNRELKCACRQLEALFIKQMLSSMRKTVPKSSLTNGGLGREVFEDMLDEKLADSFSESGAFGIADMLYEQLKTSVTGSEHDSPS